MRSEYRIHNPSRAGRMMNRVIDFAAWLAIVFVIASVLNAISNFARGEELQTIDLLRCPCTGSCCTVAPSTPQMAPLPSRCRIQVGTNGNLSLGTGSLVLGDKLVLTCSHLFDDSRENIICTFPDGRHFAGTLAELDRDNDLAAVVVQTTGITGAAVNAGEPTGDLTAGGFGGVYGNFAAVFGRVIGHVTPSGSKSLCAVMTGGCRQGDSGGGVFNCRHELVGVLWGSRDGQTYFTFGPPLAAFLSRFNNQASQPPATPPAPSIPPLQVPPATNAPPACCCDLTAINARLDALTTQVQQLAAQKPPAAAAVQPFYLRVDPQAAYQPVKPGSYVTLPLDRQQRP